MRIKRYKKAYKCLSFYINNFGFHKPFQLLIDGTFCFAALQSRIQIKEDIPKYLRSEVKFLTTQCVILESEKLGHQVVPAMKIVKNFGIHQCGHGKKPLSGSDCLMSMVKPDNSNRYIIATNDKSLQIALQKIPSVPVMYINRTSIILKSPSDSSLELADTKQKSTVELSDHQEKLLNSLKVKMLGRIPRTENEEAIMPIKKCKKPNPLSCKKKKKRPEIDQDEKTETAPKKRKRKRIRIPSHIKQEMLAGCDN